VVKAMQPLEAAVEALAVGVVVAEADGELRHVNARARELLRLGSGDAAPDWLADVLARALEQRAAVRETVEVTLDGGEALSVEIDARPVDGVGVVCTLEDLTARARREQADREFITNAAHQLRTPIAAIATAIEVLQSGAKDVPEARDRFLGHIEHQTERLVRLARAMLALARAERGDVRPALGLVPLEPLLELIVADAPSVPGVAVEHDCPSDVAVRADAPILAEALANVLANALEHTARGVVRVSARESGGSVVIEVTDTGSGIPAAELPRIFERFRHGTSVGGVGLGLAIAKAAVGAIDGSIEIDSREGSGTSVRVRLAGGRLAEADAATAP